MTVITLRGTVGTYADEGQLWERLMPAVAAQQLTPTGPGGVIEHDEQYTERDVDLEIFLPVTPGTAVEPPLSITELPSRDCLVATVTGPYSQLSSAHDLINKRLTEERLVPRNDGTVAAKAFNRYLATPDQVSQDQLVTEVCLPLS